MSRGVHIPREADTWFYFDLSDVGVYQTPDIKYGDERVYTRVYKDDERWDPDLPVEYDGEDLDLMIDELRQDLVRKYPSMEIPDRKWGQKEHLDSETLILCRNKHTIVGLSTYGGLASISLVPDDTFDLPELGAEWRARICDGLLRLIVGCWGQRLLVRTGTASNGESFYERREVDLKEKAR